MGLREGVDFAVMSKPGFVDPVEIEPDELPLFWVCCVAPQVVAEAAKPPLFISHYPGRMLVCDPLNVAQAAF